MHMAPLSCKLCAQLTNAVLTTLKSHRITTVADFLSANLDSLSQRSAISTQVLRSIHRSLVAQFSVTPVTATDVWQETSSLAALLPTGCSSLDDLLQGGVLTGEVMEVAGSSASGKTQLCLSLTAAVASSTSSSVVVVDTGAGFSASRLQEVVGEGEGEVMERVRVYRVFNVFQLLAILEDLAKNIAEQVDHFHNNLHLVVIDSVTMLLSPLLGSHPQGHALLTLTASSFHRLAHEHMVAVVYTNNMVSDVWSGGLRPALGQTWSHLPTLRITLGCAASGERTATLTSSTRQPAGLSAAFRITDTGLEPGEH